MSNIAKWKLVRCFIGVHWWVKMNIYGDKYCNVCGRVK